MRFFAVLVATTHALHAVTVTPRRHGVVCHGKKTNALLGALRRVPLVKRVVPQKKHAPRTPPPPETSVEAAPEIAELIDAEAVKAEKVLEAVVQQVVERGVAVPYEKPVEPEPKPEQPEESQIERFDRLHASPLDRTDELLKLLRDASRDTNAVDVDVEWRYARACLDASNALPEKDAKREGLTFEGLRAAERAAALAPENGLAQKWLGVMLGSVGDFQTTKEKIQNSYKVREALDAAYALRPDDATVALALGQWCLKVAGVSFVERGLARAIFGGSPPEATYAEALKFFRQAQELKPASKTKALIKLVEGKMRNGGK